MKTTHLCSPRIGLVMLTWNQQEMAIAGLSALQKAEGVNVRTILVDNGSTDGTVPRIRKEFPDVEVLALPENIGFCAANNRGTELLLQDPGIEYVMYLNNDIDWQPDCLHKLVTFMDAMPRAAACGPMMYYFDHPEIIWAAGGRIFVDLMWFPPCRKDRRLRGSTAPRRVDYIHGCGLLVRRTVIDALGMFDERFFIYHDEVEWCLRMKKAGHEVWLVPRATFYHKVSQGVGQHSPMMIYYTARNKLLFWWKHGSIKDLGAFYAFHLWKGLRIFSRVRNLWAFPALGKALLDAFLGLFGKGHIERARKS
jgi:hypothetical protein